ncbi:MAG: type III pantothenate kinase [Bacilli bacterium]
MGEEDVMKLLVDIGNTNFHFLKIKIDGKTEYLNCSREKLGLIKPLLNSDTEIYISSVNKDNLNAFLNLANSKNATKINYIRPEDFADRLKKINLKIPNLGLLAPDLFLDIIGAEASTLVADFGTASKFLFVDKSLTFQGGTLGLGLKATNTAMAGSTDLLEQYELKLPSKFISFETSEAINIDTIFGSANKLISLYWLLKKEYNEPNLKLIVTGSDAQLIADAFNRLEFKEYTIDKLHTFKGMVKALDLRVDI